ncbi:MAG: AI-2E family transporter [bacterium]
MDFAKLRNILFFGLLSVITIVFLYVIKPFMLPIFWAAVIASIFYPLYLKLKKHLKLENLSVFITLMIVFIILIIPLVLLSSLLIKESLDLYVAIDNSRSEINENISQTINWIKTNSYTKNLRFDDTFWVQKFAELTKTVTAYIFASAKGFTQNSLMFVLMFLMMFYTLYYFLRDGASMLKKIMYLSPLGDKNEQMLYNKFTSTARAVIKGTLIIGMIQGAIGGMLFFVTGMQGALIWGVIMVVASIIPALGSYIIWMPAGIVMLVIGNVWEGLLILIVGAVIIGTIDNILRPILVGKDTQMHPLLILFSTLGGIVLFGISGFVIGPIITALFISLWEMYAHHYKKELANN